MEAEEVRRVEDSIGMEETDESPTFDIIHRKRTENRKRKDGHDELPRLEQYERQAISIDPGNFIEVMKEEIRQHKRNRARTEGAPHKKQTDREREHNRRDKDQLPERLIKLREPGCGDQPETRREQITWYCSATKWVPEEYLNTHNE
jgi:hypothetical protein